MVVPKAGYIARSVITKSLTHGYIQSVVAASQSSYAAHHNNLGHLGARLSKNHNLHGQHHGLLTGDRHPATKQQQEASLKDAIAEWHQQKKLGKDWEQFQFAKRIEWKPHNLLAESRTTYDGVNEPDRDGKLEETESSLPELNRFQSTNAADEFQEPRDQNSADATLERLPEQIITGKLADEMPIDVARQVGLEESLGRTTSDSSIATVAHTSPSSAESILTSVTTNPDIDAFTEQLNFLADSHRYAEVPAVFEGMLHAGITPTSQAYNALLLAAIALPRRRYQVVPKAFDVYSDMLKRSVAPDFQTYCILVELLAARALEVQLSITKLEKAKARFGGLEKPGNFMLQSENLGAKLLASDDSLNLALRIFQDGVAVNTKGFPEHIYHLLISALAQQHKVSEMVQIYQLMEARRITPRPETFVNMIEALATSGNLRSAVECYDEYKALAILNDQGELTMERKDEDVYAAVIKAYLICGESEGAERILGKIQTAVVEEPQAQQYQEAITLRAYISHFLDAQKFQEAFTCASEHLIGIAREIGLSAVCIRAADKDSYEIAARAFSQLSQKADIALAASSMLAMHIRSGNLDASEPFWNMLERAEPHPDFIQPMVMRSVALIGSGQADQALPAMRKMFARIREATPVASLMEHVDEAIETVGSYMSTRGIFLNAHETMEFLWTMVETNSLVPSVVRHLLAGLGPESIAQIAWVDLEMLAQVQGSMIINNNETDLAHESRFAHILGLLANGMVDTQTTKIIDKALVKLNKPFLWSTWRQQKYVQPSAGMFVSKAPALTPQPAYEDSHDPYAATTDNKGSVAITELLEKSHGRHVSVLTDAMARFNKMRRAGRHPRYFTYAKIISAAAKDNQLQIACDVLALARQDVPYLPQYRIVRYGWITILDSMTAAGLTCGRRDLAHRYHQELLTMGAAPSANTFGLYITTLKESTKTFDEASEAVRIFMRAKSEGVEPSSFLFNALIGKLGKARRIDDCLFYFQEMRDLGIRPTSVTYGTIVNALCRVSDERFAEELFEEMESMPNYKARPAPYHSMMQFFLTKRDRNKVLNFYERMRARGIQPTAHTYKLLIDTYATIQPIDMASAEGVLEQIKQHGEVPEAVHYASLIHAKGCVLRDMEGARKLFDTTVEQTQIRLQPCLFQAIFESMVANDMIEQSEPLLSLMQERRVEMTPYIANALIHGWANAKNINQVEAVYNMVKTEAREPSTYETMTRAYMASEQREMARKVVDEALSRGYPAAVASKISDLVADHSVNAD